MKRPVALAALAGTLVLLATAALSALLVWEVRFRRPPLMNGEVAFETLERDRAPDSPTHFFPRQAPGLLVLTSVADIPSVSRFVNSSAVQGLRDLDWDANFAIVVFRGWQADSVAEFRVERLVRQDDNVSIYASTGLVGEERIPTSPYHLVAVRKVGQWKGMLTFCYDLDAVGEVASAARDIPESTWPLWK